MRLLSRPENGTQTRRLLDLFLPDKLLASDTETRHRARLVVLVYLLFVVATLLISPIELMSGAPAGQLAVLGPGLCSVAALLALRLNAPLPWIANAIPAILYCGCMGLTLASGGDAVGAMVTTPMVPVIAIALVGRRSALFWTVAVLAGLVATAVLASTLESFPFAGAQLAWYRLRFPIMLVMAK